MPDEDKFDGVNWIPWSKWIKITSRLRGAHGYLDGTIPRPAEPSKPSESPADAADIPLPPDSTEWMSMRPSINEWILRDAWIMGLLLYNTKNPIGLGMNLDGTGAEAWKSLEDQYAVTSDLALIQATRELHSVKYVDGTDIMEHIAILRTKWSNANTMGAKIHDKDFRIIIMASLPSPSWDNIVSALYDSKTSADVITRIMMHWDRIKPAVTVTTPGSTALALQANTNRSARKNKPLSPLICSNPNCGRRGHLIDTCYWPGGGKAGQFPAGFGQRGGATGSSVAGTPSTPVAHGPAANVAQIPDGDRVYALMASLKEPPVEDPNNVSFEIRALLAENQHRDVNTYADSGATEHFFVNRSDFSSYKTLDENITGNAAEKDSTFRIAGFGVVKKSFRHEGKQTHLTFKNAMHTPDLAANLVSISRFDSAGHTATFGGGRVVFRNKSGESFLSGLGKAGMYLLDDVKQISDYTHIPFTAMNAKSLVNPASIEKWHRRFGHAGITGISNMARKSLVDGLDVIAAEPLPGRCEDCIYGKHTARPYDAEVVPETEALECVHVDLWGKARVRSLGGAVYMLLLSAH